MNVVIKKSTRKDKKLMAVFPDRTVHFGAAGMSDYTIHKDKERKQRYIDRHRKNENWNDYKSAGALSYHILWGPTTSLKKNIELYKKKFNLRE